MQVEHRGTGPWSEREGEHWFALKTRAQHEKAVRDRLARLGFEHLLPVYPRVSQWHDRKRVIETPLFPGYCFARMSLQTRTMVLQLPGVAYIVGRGGVPEAIPPVEIEGLRRLATCGLPYNAEPCWAEGDLVEIVRGPLQGVRGTFVRRGEAHYVVLGVKLIQQGATVKVDVQDVQRIRHGSAAMSSVSIARPAELLCNGAVG